MSQARPSRRRVLVAGATTTALLLAGPTALTGCTTSPPMPEGPDPLESPARRAEADTAQAITAAQLVVDTDAGLAAVASALAADRMAHATALRAELRRVRPGPVPDGAAAPAASPAAPSSTEPPPTSPPPAGSSPASPDLAGTRSALIRAMHAAQDEAAALVLTLPGYRAALLASVAACCATHAALLR
ncbi:MAG: hypothetical protein ACRDRA_14625 [Pseudonocardiaceae bacterium]